MIMSKGAPPSSVSVCFSLNQEDNDSYSKLSGQSSYAAHLLQDDDNVGIELVAESYYQHHHALDSSNPSQTENNELLELKLRILRQQERLDILASKLSQCEVENELLEAEKAVLVNELAPYFKHDEQATANVESNCFSKTIEHVNVGSLQLPLGINTKLVADHARLQMLTDIMRKSFQSHMTDSRRSSAEDKRIIESLRQENKLLRHQMFLVPGRSHADLSKSETLAGTRKAYDTANSNYPTQRLGLYTHKTLNVSESERTAKTFPLDRSGFTQMIKHPSVQKSLSINLSESEYSRIYSFDTSEFAEQYHQEYLPLVSFQQLNQENLDLIPVLEGKQNEPTLDNLDTKEAKRGIRPTQMDSGGNGGTATLGAALQKRFTDLIVDFGESRRPKAVSMAKRWKSLAEGSARNDRKSEELLVNFGEARRSRSVCRRWHSFEG